MTRLIGLSGRSIAGWLLVTSLGCDTHPPKRQAPPPDPKPATCAGVARVNQPDNVAFFPKQAGPFCLDPAGSDRAYDDPDQICTLFDGECDVYKRFDLQRSIEVHYVDGGGSGATIDVYLSKFSSADNAYGMFTKRVVGDGDPAHPDTPRPIDGGAAAALGIGNAYLVRGPFLAELTVNDAAASAEQIKKRADEVLPRLVAEVASKLPGKPELPAAAAALPSERRIPLGVLYMTKDVLGVQGTGEGAFGYYRQDAKRWRILSMVKADVDQAKDALGAFARLRGAAEEKGLGDGARRVTIQVGGATEWVIVRKGARVIGIGDESRVLRTGMSAEEHAEKCLSLEEKKKLLASLLESDAPR